MQNAHGRISGRGPEEWGRGGPGGRKAHHQPMGQVQNFPKGQRPSGVNESLDQLIVFSPLLLHFKCD